MFFFLCFWFADLYKQGSKRAAGKDVARIILGHGLSPIQPDIDRFHGHANRHCLLDPSVCGLFAVDEDLHRSAIANTASVILEFEPEFAFTFWQFLLCSDLVGRTEPVVPNGR